MKKIVSYYEEHEDKVKILIPDIIDNLNEEVLNIVPCQITGLDTAVGIRNIGGDSIGYIKILRAFYMECSHIMQELDEYLAEDRNMFRIKLHGMKNSCSCIGIASLAEEARGLEHAVLTDGGAFVDTSLFYFKKNMNSLLTEIYQYLEQLSIVNMSYTEDKRELCLIPGIPREPAAILRQAIQHMETEEIAAELAVIRRLRYEKPIELYLTRLSDCLDAYEYERAIDILDRITEQI